MNAPLSIGASSSLQHCNTAPLHKRLEPWQVGVCCPGAGSLSILKEASKLSMTA